MIAFAPAKGVKLAAAGLCAVVLVPVLAMSAAAGRVLGTGAPTSSGPAASWGGDVPAEMAALYDEAARRFGIPVGLLAAVGKAECDHGRDPRCTVPNRVGALGPMQFIPTTWASWWWASGSPMPSRLDPRDAVMAAAAMLAAHGAADDPVQALLRYNPSSAYVATVEAWALLYGWRPPRRGVLADAVLHHPSIGLRPEAAADVRAGVVDDAVLAEVLVAATRYRLSWVGPFVTGHSYYVAGTSRPSYHAFGRAVDVPVVDGLPVSPTNGAARDVAALWASLPPDLRPDELGSPWAEPAPGVRVFSEGHDDHLHAGRNEKAELFHQMKDSGQ